MNISDYICKMNNDIQTIADILEHFNKIYTANDPGYSNDVKYSITAASSIALFVVYNALDNKIHPSTNNVA